MTPGQRLNLLSLLLLFCSAAWPYRTPERWSTLNPLESLVSDTESGWVFLPGGSAWGDFGPYLLGDIDHAWSSKIGGYAELFRYGPKNSLGLTGSIDLVADPHNTLGFNPRSVFWEEGLLFTRRSSGNALYQIGYFHRCKHDVENLSLGVSSPFPAQRSLVYGGALGSVLFPVSLGEVAALFVVRGDLYTLLEETRIPEISSGPHLETMQGTLTVRIHARTELAGSWLGALVDGYGSVTTYGTEKGFIRRFGSIGQIGWNGGLRVGISLQGDWRLDIALGYERLHDTGIYPEPRSADLMLLALKVLDPKIRW